MSHEIRTPMNGVLGMAQILENTDLNPRQKEFIQTIQSSGNALMNILNDVLDFSKIEAGKLELDPTNSNLREAVEDVATVMGPRANEKGLQIVVRYEPGIPEMAIVDIGRLRQVLLNLVGNGLKFTHTGYVLINVTADVKGGDADYCFEVLDTGIGIPEDRIQTIFEDFKQAENSTTRRFGGTGLGLTISQRLIEAMDGTLSVKSKYGRGSAFTVALTLPLTSPQTSDIKRLVSACPPKILIADDLSVSRTVLFEQLQSWGLKCTIATTGQAAYQKLTERNDIGDPFDLVIIDSDLKDLNGEQLATAIRKSPRISKMDIIVLSTVDKDEKSLQLEKMNLSGFISKPVKSTVLYHAIRKIVSHSSDPLQSGTAPFEIEAEESKTAPVSPPKLKTKTSPQILIAEDNATNRAVIKNLLDTEAVQLSFALDGKQAYEMTRQIDFDMIFMDYSMPIMDGIESTQAIRAEEVNHGRKRTPIICLSAHVTRHHKEQALNAGMDDYLNKPILISPLQSMIEKWADVKHYKNNAVKKSA